MDSQIWSEKHRPTSFEEVKGQKEIIKRIKALVETKNIPHMLFSGPAGVGKTTTSLIIAKQLHKTNWRSNFLELNASVTGDTPIMIKEGDKIKRTNFQYLANKFLIKENKKNVKGIKILSITKDKKVKFLPVKEIMRHTIERIIKIKYEGGEVKTSVNHSIIVINKKGDLESKRAGSLRKDDLLITFKTNYSENNKELDISDYRSQEYLKLRSGLIKNPTLNSNFDTFKLNKDTSWLLGLYMAEGCIGQGKTSDYMIYTLAYPQERKIADEVQNLYKKYFSINSTTELGESGFDRTKLSSIRIKVFNSQVSRFYLDNFYGDSKSKTAPFKRVPSFIFETTKENKLAFFNGYFGDGHGKLNDFVRYSSSSKEGLIDIAWLGRLCNLYTSTFKEETHAIWDKGKTHSYLQTNYIPSELIINFLESIRPKINFNYRYELRHALYNKKSKRLTREVTLKILSKINRNKLNNKEGKIFSKIEKLINSDLTIVKIRSIKEEEYQNYVYDVSVPGSQMFWGGTTPILLHNSDSRGIDTIRNQVKDFAKTMAIEADAPKIILLDEADALTKEAQQALRRTMETYSNSCRFILSCNLVNKIIDPIKSRCAIFKFKQLDKEEIEEIIKNIAKNEGLKINDEVVKLLFEHCGGDVRQLQNVLQSCSATSKEITKEEISQFLTTIESKDIEDVIKLALSKNFLDARKKLLDTMLNHGLSGLDIVKAIQKEILTLQMDDEKKLNIIERCGEIEFRLVEGSDDFIQIEALLAFIVKK